MAQDHYNACTIPLQLTFSVIHSHVDLNLLDWSCNNHLAVCLGGHIYLWNATTGDITQLLEMEGPDEYVASVAWIKDGNILAVGSSTGDVQLWDVAQQKKMRSMTGHAARVGALSWNSYILSRYGKEEICRWVGHPLSWQ